MALAELEVLLRKAAERTIEGLWTAICRLVGVFTLSLHQLLGRRRLRCKSIGKIDITKLKLVDSRCTALQA